MKKALMKVLDEHKDYLSFSTLARPVGIKEPLTGFYTTSEVASWLRVCPATVRKYAREHKLGAVRVARRLLYPAGCLEQFMKDHRIGEHNGNRGKNRT